MCAVSMVGDHYRDKWGMPKPGQINPEWRTPNSFPPFPTIYPTQPAPIPEIEALRREVEEMKELLKRAIQYDKDNNQPHCEQEDKIKFLRQVAESVGISLDDVFGGKDAT